MKKRQAVRLEETLQQSVQGQKIDHDLVPLIATVRKIGVLAESPPVPPRHLAPGRQRFLITAAQLEEKKGAARSSSMPTWRVTRLAPALIAALLVFSLVFGVSRAAAASLPGQPLYELKLTAEESRLGMTRDPESRSQLLVSRARVRLEEISRLVEKGQAVDDGTVGRAQEQLLQALEAAAQRGNDSIDGSFQRLMVAVQQYQRTMQSAVNVLPNEEQMPVRQLLREMERVRQELHLGQGEPSGELERTRSGVPPDPASLPDPSEQPGPGPGTQATRGPLGPLPADAPGSGPVSTVAAEEPDPKGIQGAGPGPQPTAGQSWEAPAGQPGSSSGERPEDQPGSAGTGTPEATPDPMGTGPLSTPAAGGENQNQGPAPDAGNGAGGSGRP